MGTKQLSVPFKNGRFRIWFFDSVLHGSEEWSNGYRGFINVSMKKKLLEHFVRRGNKYYSQFVSKGYPKGKFVAK